MAGKSVAEKLLFKPGYLAAVLNEPEGYREMLGKMPDNVTILNEATEPVDLAQVFVTTKAEMERQLSGLRPFLKPGALLWMTYPKGTARIKSEVNRDSIREYAEQNGWKAVAMISVDDTWSALRLKTV